MRKARYVIPIGKKSKGLSYENILEIIQMADFTPPLAYIVCCYYIFGVTI